VEGTAVKLITRMIMITTFFLSSVAMSSLWTASVAFAQEEVPATEPAPTVETVPTVETETPVDTVTRTSPTMRPDDLKPFGVGLGALAVICLVLLLGFVAYALNRYYAAAIQLEFRGIRTKSSDQPTFASLAQPSPTAGASAAAGIDEPPGALIVQGPGVVTVGVVSNEFTAHLDLVPQVPADQAIWSVDPASAAAVTPIQGASTKVIAATAGAFALKATLAGTDANGTAWTKSSTPLQVAAIAAAANGPTELPFLGRAFGTLIAIILLIAAVVFLALWGTLDGQAVATFVGGLLGYVFGVQAQSLGGASGTAAAGGTPATD
jgi:hypothetical protein